MLDPQTMTESEEQEARDKAFYLVKRYTSYTFLDRARLAYQEFLDAFAWQLNDPECIQFSDLEEYRRYVMEFGAAHEGQYSSLLEEMARLEEGLKLLRMTADKTKAYGAILRSTFGGLLWGRGAIEWGLHHDPFYDALGLNSRPEEVASDERPGVDLASEVFEVLRSTLNGNSRWLRNQSVETCQWTYGTMFDGDKSSARAIFAISYPRTLPSCPPKNLSSEHQIWSGDEIPTTGIWEPWFVEETFWEGIVSRLVGKRPSRFIGKVGCPNYFLAGTIAFEYKMECSSQEEKVAWRLLWKDTRYLDGRITAEENAYFAASETTQSDVRTARTGDPCPESGEWYAMNWERKRMKVESREGRIDAWT